MRKEPKVGSTIEYRDITYKVVKSKKEDCSECAFKDEAFYDICSTVNCTADARKDNIDIHFIEVEQ